METPIPCVDTIFVTLLREMPCGKCPNPIWVQSIMLHLAHHDAHDYLGGPHGTSLVTVNPMIRDMRRARVARSNSMQ